MNEQEIQKYKSILKDKYADKLNVGTILLVGRNKDFEHEIIITDIGTKSICSHVNLCIHGKNEYGIWLWEIIKYLEQGLWEIIEK